MNPARPLLLLSALSLLACSLFSPPTGGPAATSRDVDDPVFTVDEEDPEMNAAIAAAQASLDEFSAALASPTAAQSGFMVKARFLYDQAGASYEHMWLDELTVTDGGFTGTLSNAPVYVETLAFGDVVTVPRADVTDWFYIEDGRLVGGYTIRVLRDRMTDEEREAFDREWGLSFEDE